MSERQQSAVAVRSGRRDSPKRIEQGVESVTTRKYELRILEHLNILWNARGIPQPVIAKALSLSISQVSKRFNGHIRLSAAELMVILRTLEVEPGEFFAGLGGGFHAELYLAHLEKEEPRRLKYAKSDCQRHAPSRSYSVESLQQMAEGLQELRLVNADEACTQALEILRAVRHDGLAVGARTECLARIALGAIYRSRGNWSTAAYFLRDSLRIADKEGSLKGRILQAVMSLAIDRGEEEVALAAIQRALTEYTRAEDWRGFGRALVSQGVLLAFHGRESEAIAAYQRSLSLLPEEEWFGRFAALHGIGVAEIYQGNLDAALASATSALAVLDSQEASPLQIAAGLWLQGEIFLQSGLIGRATENFQAVMDTYERERVSDLDQALISLRLAAAFHLSGRLDKIEELTSRLIARLGRLSARSKHVAGAIAQLHGSVIRGELSEELISSTYREILEKMKLVPPAAKLALTVTP